MIIGAIAWESSPGHLHIVATTGDFAITGQRMVSRSAADARSYSTTPVEHLSALLRGSVTANQHDQAHSAVYAITTVLGASYAILTPAGIMIAEAATFGQFIDLLE